jgi:2-oxoglutarate ferredoxin oxidoreductase subunit alpha
MPAPIVERRDGATIGVVSVGSCDLAVREAVVLLGDAGIAVDFIRIRGFPFASDVRGFLDDHDVCFVVEQNRDAQLRSLLVIETSVAQDKLRSVLVYGGFPLSAKQVVEGITRQLED